MSASKNSIFSIMPKGEGFSPMHFGAVALCMRDFTLHSRYKATTTIISTVPCEGFEGIRYVALPPSRWYENRTRSYARQCVDLIRDEKPDLVEIHNRPNLLRLIAPKVNCRFALHFHNDPQEIRYSRTPRERTKLLATVDGVYCVSQYIRDRFAEGLDPALHEKIHIVYNGIESPASVPEKENIITFAGRMTSGKGAKLLAQALHIALPQLPDWKAVFIGSGRHAVARKRTSHEKEIGTILHPYGRQVKVTGFLSHTETLNYFGRSAIAVVPSVWQEPFGRTALEAMAYGCALVSSGRGGLREVTAETAVTIDHLTPHTLAEGILTLVESTTERQRLQTIARERAARHFSIQACTKSLDTARDAILSHVA